MGSHLINGKFQSDKYPTCPPGKVPLSVEDPMAQDLLLEYARRRRAVDAEFSDDLRASLLIAGYDPLAPDVPRGGDTTGEVFFYERPYYCLSNFSAFAVTCYGVDFSTSEHAYQWCKFGGRGELDDGGRPSPAIAVAREAIRTARSAHMAFKLARSVYPTLVRPDWPSVRVDVMRQILREKAAQHPYVRRKLLASGQRRLVENSWRDDFWGWGEHGVGRNMLGELWMEVRSEIRSEVAAVGAAPR